MMVVRHANSGRGLTKWQCRLPGIIQTMLLSCFALSFISLFSQYFPARSAQPAAIEDFLLAANITLSATTTNVPPTPNDSESANVSEINIRRNSSSNSRNKVSGMPNYAIFYNVYINPKNVTRGVEIIQEQTMQIFKKLGSRNRISQVPLYFNMIGYNYSAPFCPPAMSCTFLDYYDKAFEEVTLQHLFDHCMRNPVDSVYYLHNKGSFSNNYYNDQKRRKLTNVLFHRSHKHLDHDSSRNCNVASVGWEPLPHWHFRGNFWLAKCSYVRNLIPPTDFGHRRISLFRRLLQTSGTAPSKDCLRSYFKETTTADIFQQPVEVQDNVGIGRYNNEIWITSHPDVVPCDIADTVFTSNITSKRLFHEGYAEHEWFRMHGRLFEFYQLYGKLPSNSSFFWDYYGTAKEPTAPPKCRRDIDRSTYYNVIL